MAYPKVKLSDNSGNTVAVDTSGASNALKVALAAGPIIDIGDVEIKGHGTVAHTTMNVTDSAVALPVAGIKHADIMATLTNTGIVYIGASGVSDTSGVALYPGDVYSVSITNLQHLYAISTVDGDDLNIVVYY